MGALELPYPCRRARGAGAWSSRARPTGVRGPPRRTGRDQRRARRSAVSRGCSTTARRRRSTWAGGAFGPGETAPDHPFAQSRGALRDEVGREAAPTGVPWGADMRLFTARGIPGVMFGTPGIERAHAVDESSRCDELADRGPHDHPGRSRRCPTASDGAAPRRPRPCTFRRGCVDEADRPARAFGQHARERRPAGDSARRFPSISHV